MKSTFLVICISFLVCACEYDNAETLASPSAFVGTWRTEKIYLNGIDSEVYVPFLSDFNELILHEDHTFLKNYRKGEWQLNQYEIVLKESGNSSYVIRGAILELSPNKFVVEYRLTESEYCCDFESFESDEVIKIREVYRREII